MLVAQDEYQEFSEDITPDRFPIFAGLYPSLSVPIADFGTNMDKLGFGGGVQFLMNLNQSPFSIGVTSNIANFGNETLEFIDAEGFESAWKTNSSLWDGHFLIQFEPPIGTNFQPYIIGQAGFNHFFTITRFVDVGGDGETLDRYVDDNNWGYSYGGAVGTLIPLEPSWRFMLDVRASYLKGADASFYSKTPNATILGDTLDAFELRESPVDLVRFSVGVLAYLR